jgi:hypothetical protein
MRYSPDDGPITGWKWSGNGRETEGQWKGSRMEMGKAKNIKNDETIETLIL